MPRSLAQSVAETIERIVTCSIFSPDEKLLLCTVIKGLAARRGVKVAPHTRTESASMNGFAAVLAQDFENIARRDR
jgi:hypothetical protein